MRAITSTTTDAEPTTFPLRVLRQDRPLPRRMAEGGVVLGRAARGADVIYASGLYARSAVAASAQRKPLVLKLTNDPAFERARTLGLFDGTLEDFQHPQRHPGITALKLVRRWTLANATRVIVPSQYLARIVSDWSSTAPSPVIIHNPRPDLRPSASREQLRQRFGLRRFTTVFAGRFVAQKNLTAAIDAFSRQQAGDLVLIGDGPERTSLEARVKELQLQDRVRVVPAVPRQDVLDWFAAADLAVLPSAWENYPHSAVEALTVGTPVLATAVGGVPEIVCDGETGLLVPPGDVDALASALERCVRDPDFMSRLRTTSRCRPAGVSDVEAFSQLECVLRTASSPDQAALTWTDRIPPVSH